jgi:hypothetical protein
MTFDVPRTGMIVWLILGEINAHGVAGKKAVRFLFDATRVSRK